MDLTFLSIKLARDDKHGQCRLKSKRERYTIK